MANDKGPCSEDWMEIDIEADFVDPPYVSLTPEEQAREEAKTKLRNEQPYIRYSFFIQPNTGVMWSELDTVFESFIHRFHGDFGDAFPIVHHEFDFAQLPDGGSGVVFAGLQVDIHATFKLQPATDGFQLYGPGRGLEYEVPGWRFKAGERKLWSEVISEMDVNRILVGTALQRRIWNLKSVQAELDLLRGLVDEPPDLHSGFMNSAYSPGEYYRITKVVGENHPLSERLWRKDGQEVEDAANFEELEQLLSGCSIKYTQVDELSDLLSGSHLNKPNLGKVADPNGRWTKLSELLESCQPQPNIPAVVNIVRTKDIGKNTTETLIHQMGFLGLSG